MKYLIILITTITSLNLYSQDHFSLTEGEVSWQKVYETKKSKDAIITHFENSGLFKLFKVEDGKIFATLKPQTIDKDDKKIVGTLPPPIVIKNSYTGKVSIGIKDGKYRVTYQEIMLVGDGEIIKKGEKQPFEKHFVNKDGKAFRISFGKKPKTIYNLAFSQTFLIENAKSDDW